MTMPLVSIIIPTYNNARFLPDALASVSQQDYPQLEIVVVDDGSTDETTAVLAQYDDLRIIRQANAGSAAARNVGLAQSRGELVIFLDADDYFLPERVPAHVAFLRENPDIGVAHSGWRKMSADGLLIQEVTPWLDAPVLDLADWLRWKPVFFGAMTFRREWLEKVDGLNPQLRQAHDVDLAWRLALAGCPFGWIKRPLVAYRQHDTNTTRDGRIQAESLDALLTDFFARSDLPVETRALEPETRRNTWLWAAYHLVICGQLDEMVDYLEKALAVSAPNLPEAQFFAWARQFWQWAEDDGREMEAMTAAFPHFWQVLAPADPELLPDLAQWWASRWPEAWSWSELDAARTFARIIINKDRITNDSSELSSTPFNVWHWWADVWQAVSVGEWTAVEWQRLNGLSVAEMTFLWQESMAQTHVLPPVARVRQLWRNWLAAAGEPAGGKKGETAVLLTLFGQNVFARRWRQGGAALAAAMGNGWQWPAWRRFLQKSGISARRES